MERAFLFETIVNHKPVSYLVFIAIGREGL